MSQKFNKYQCLSLLLTTHESPTYLSLFTHVHLYLLICLLTCYLLTATFFIPRLFPLSNICLSYFCFVPLISPSVFCECFLSRNGQFSTIQHRVHWMNSHWQFLCFEWGCAYHWSCIRMVCRVIQYDNLMAGGAGSLNQVSYATEVPCVWSELICWKIWRSLQTVGDVLCL